MRGGVPDAVSAPAALAAPRLQTTQPARKQAFKQARIARGNEKRFIGCSLAAAALQGGRTCRKTQRAGEEFAAGQDALTHFLGIHAGRRMYLGGLVGVFHIGLPGQALAMFLLWRQPLRQMGRACLLGQAVWSARAHAVVTTALAHLFSPRVNAWIHRVMVGLRRFRDDSGEGPCNRLRQAERRKAVGDLPVRCWKARVK